MLLLSADLIFANLPPGARRFFESGKRRDPRKFLRRDGVNTAIGDIDMNSNIIQNVMDPLSSLDVAIM